MGQGASSAADADLIAAFARRLERLARLKHALGDAGREGQLVHAATRSTLVDLARLGQAELAVAIVARARPRRSRREADALDRRSWLERASDGRARRPPQ